LLPWSRIPRRRRTESASATAASLKHRDEWSEIAGTHELTQHPSHHLTGACLVERIEHERDAIHLQRRVALLHSAERRTRRRLSGERPRDTIDSRRAGTVQHLHRVARGIENRDSHLRLARRETVGDHRAVGRARRLEHEVSLRLSFDG
jgi:hypothetical protein